MRGIVAGNLIVLSRIVRGERDFVIGGFCMYRVTDGRKGVIVNPSHLSAQVQPLSDTNTQKRNLSQGEKVVEILNLILHLNCCHL